MDDALPKGMGIVNLPGHFFSMVGFRTSDDVVYLADCLSSAETLDKYGITFIYDVGAYLETLVAVKNMNAKVFVPSHADATEDIVPLADYNIRKVQETADRIVEICKEPLHFEIILQKLFSIYNLKMDFQQYVLVGSTVRSYLSWLKNTGRLEVLFEDNLLLWKTL